MSPIALPADALRSLMRRHRITIRALSARMDITQRRVRHCRRAGVDHLWTAIDWIEAITGRSWDRGAELHNPASVREWIRQALA